MPVARGTSVDPEKPADASLAPLGQSSAEMETADEGFASQQPQSGDHNARGAVGQAACQSQVTDTIDQKSLIRSLLFEGYGVEDIALKLNVEWFLVRSQIALIDRDVGLTTFYCLARDKWCEEAGAS